MFAVVFLFFFHCKLLSVGVVRKMGYVCGSILSRMVTDSPQTGLLLTTSSKTLPTTTPGMTITSGHAAISTGSQRSQVGADLDLVASTLAHLRSSSIHSVDVSPSWTAEDTLLPVRTHCMFRSTVTESGSSHNHWVTHSAWCWIIIKSAQTTWK